MEEKKDTLLQAKEALDPGLETRPGSGRTHVNPINPEVVIRDTKGAELKHILYLVQLQLHIVPQHSLLNPVS